MHFPVSLPAIVSLCSIAVAGPLKGRQEVTGNSSTADLIAQCAPSPFAIHQFTTFSGSDTASPEISFFFTNDNGVDVTEGVVGAPFLCSVTLPADSNIMSDYAVWSCENGTGFKFDTNSVLTVSQSMICDSLWPGAPIWALANGTVEMTSMPGVDGGIYNTSTQTNIYLDVMDIIESIPVSVYALPTCGQMCLGAELKLGPSFGCSPGNYTCLCESVPFVSAFRDCLVASCDSVDETQESNDFFTGYCVESGVFPATPSPTVPRK